MKPVRTHPEKSIRFTEHSKEWCILINLYKKKNPKKTFAQIAEDLNLSEVTARRYYYGIHHFNPSYEMGGRGYTQVREGACVPI